MNAATTHEIQLLQTRNWINWLKMTSPLQSEMYSHNIIHHSKIQRLKPFNIIFFKYQYLTNYHEVTLDQSKLLNR